MATISDAEHGLSEAAPLLHPSIPTVDAQIESTEALRERPSQLRILTILLIYVIFLDLGFEMILPAQTRAFEAIYCKGYYKKHEPGLIGSDGRDGIDEKWCKVGVIQGEVAMLKGWDTTFDSIGMLIFSLPWGYVADSYGRKPVILLVSIALSIKYAYIQLICWFGGSLPLRLIWLSAMHTALGGSISNASALIYTIVSDVFPESKRATLFFQLVAVSFITRILGPLISAVFMERSPWIPMMLGLAVEIVGVGLIAFIPETLNYSGSLSPESTPSSAELTTPVKPVSKSQSLFHHVPDSISFLISDVRIISILSAFAVHMLLQSRDVLLQYISTRYQTSLALATVFVSIRSGLVLLLYSIVLPATRLYFRRRFGPNWSDLFLSRASAAFIAIGFLMIGLAPNRSLLIFGLVVNSMGWGLFSFLRSLLTSIVEAHHVARLNTFIGVFDTIGQMIGSPLLAMLFRTGLEFGGVASGLPFLIYAGIAGMIGIILCRIEIHP